MKYILITALLSICNFCNAQFKKTPLWQDEFEGEGTPNLAIWERANTKPSGKIISGYCPTDENAYIKDGYLHLRIIHDSSDKQKPYKSGRIMSKNNIPIRYGKLVIRAKASPIPGEWPALWLRPFPGNKQIIKGELDIMEYSHIWKDSLVQINYHLWGNFRGKKDNHIEYPKTAKLKVSDWHTYQLEIHKKKLIVRIDDKIVYSVKKGEKGKEWPFGEDWQLLLAHAYGGEGLKLGADDSQLPAEFLIDYVRYYPLK